MMVINTEEHLQADEEKFQVTLEKNTKNFIQTFNDLGYFKHYGMVVKAQQAALLVDSHIDYVRKQEREGRLVGMWMDEDRRVKRFGLPDLIGWIARRRTIAELELEE